MDACHLLHRDVCSYGLQRGDWQLLSLLFRYEIILIIRISKFIYFSYIDIIISVYGIMFIDNDIINNIIIRMLYSWNFVDFIIINNISCVLVYSIKLCSLHGRDRWAVRENYNRLE